MTTDPQTRPERRGPRLPLAWAEVAVASALVATCYSWAYAEVIAPALAVQGGGGTASSERGTSETGHADGRATEATSYLVTADELGTWHSLSVLGTESFSTSDGLAQLADAIEGFEGKGYELGFSVWDARTGDTLEYNADQDFYTASAIKGPYVTSVFEELVDTHELSLDDVLAYAEPIIVSSDNAAYAELSQAVGRDCFATWLEDHDVPTGAYDDLASYAEPLYPRSTPRQLAREWRGVYRYLLSGMGESEALRDLFDRREVSPIKQALDDRYETTSKAGWYPTDEGIADPVTNDAGVVWVDGAPYVVAVMSSAPEDFDSVAEVVSAIDAAIPDLTGRS